MNVMDHGGSRRDHQPGRYHLDGQQPWEPAFGVTSPFPLRSHYSGLGLCHLLATSAHHFDDLAPRSAAASHGLCAGFLGYGISFRHVHGLHLATGRDHPDRSLAAPGQRLVDYSSLCLAFHLSGIAQVLAENFIQPVLSPALLTDRLMPKFPLIVLNILPN